MMKRKLSVVLVAAALELYTISLAQAACPVDGATPFNVGPVNPVSTFAEYVTDSRGVSLQRCTDAANCFYDPVVAGNLLSEQIGTGGESFFWLADNKIDIPATGFAVRLVMAAEAAFLSPEPVDGQQFSFTRLRIWIDAPRPGTYTVIHPFGRSVYTIDAVGAGFDSRETIDISFTPGQLGAQGRVGPWLKWDPAVAPAAPVGFLGDLGTAHPVVGSPCNTNYLQVSAVDLNGLPINLDGNGSNVVRSNDFVVNGQIYDGRVQTPVSSPRTTYSRTPLTVGQIDEFAASVIGATVSIKDAPNTDAAKARLTTDRPLVTDGNGKFFTSEVLANAPNTAALPVAIAVTASATPATATSAGTDASTLIRPLVDQVVVTQADYDITAGTLTVNATSSDTRVPPVLTLQEYLTPVGQAIPTVAPPAVVTVMSSAGGWAQAKVRTAPALPPTAPSGLTGTANTATQVTLNWLDNAGNETSYEVSRNGVVIATLAANATSYVDTAAPSGSSITYQVYAVNSGGRSASNVATVTTPVGLNAPSGLTATAVTATSVALGWLDNSNNETGFQVQRNGVVIATVAANVASYTDTTVAASTAYTYQVVATATGVTAASNVINVTTPAAVTLLAPTNLTAVRPANDETVTRLAWTDASTGETAYRVQRTTYTVAANGTVTAAAFATTTTPTGNLAANAVAYTNTGTALNTLYGYQVNAANGATQGPAALVNRYTGTLPAVGGLSSNVMIGLLGIGATAKGNVPLRWTASGAAAVAGYDIQRCIGTTTVCTATSGNWTDVTRVMGRATASYTVTGLDSGVTQQFRIRTHTGTVGLTGAYSAAVAGRPN